MIKNFRWWIAGLLALASALNYLDRQSFPAKIVGSVEGLLGSAGSFGGMLFGLLVGWLVERRGYGPAFLLAGVLHPQAFLILLATVKRIGPLRGEPPFALAHALGP